MECYSEETCALAVDGELAPDEARRLRDHLATCRRCRDLVDALRTENQVLGEILNELPEEAANFSGLPHLRRSWVWGDLAVMGAVLALGSIVSVWFNTLSIPATLEWLNPFNLNTNSNLIFDVVYDFARGGTAMFANYAAVVGFLSLVLLFGSVLLLGRRGRPRLPGLHLIVALLLLSLPSFALERRHGDFITVSANETIDDTLFAAGNTVRMDGVINGDLFVFGRNVEVRGTVKGDLVTFSKRTVVSGSVEGRIYTFSESLDLDGQLGHSLYAAAQSLRVNDRAHVGEGIVAAAGDVSVDGEVKRSLDVLSSRNIDVSGSIGRDLNMAGSNAATLTLTNTARVGGNFSARVPDVKNVRIADGATITGKRDVQVSAHVRQSQFTRPRFYFHQAVWFAAALLVGWLGLVLFPNFFRAATQEVGSGWRSLALGIGVLAGVPVAMIVIGITLVGLPISLMLLMVYLTGLYLAKIWVGAFLGRMLMKSGSTTGDWVLGLLVGLLILTVVGYIPYLGGLVHFGVVCLGLGAFAAQIYHASRPPITA